ncbi:hypothetical protein BCR34DRAFT_626138 [Clohesyomyces aquaticus]|uniref:NmrA-like domain-containing protein n=1 Tax=Clohesyomyces aquaticus TaxID=1231657 RepID=A0A1Y1ZEK5_9PLEO|nr:hypothetical protein BCR34DRAFT_626138 [Clohesyomyces aquaticus]
MSKKILTVFGATGNQGGSVANVVLDDPQLSKEWTVRAITRDITNPKALALKAKGAEIIEADMDNPNSLSAALKSAHTVFALTNTQYGGGDITREVETRQAKAVCSEAVSQGVKCLIWSSMSHPFKISNGKLTHVDHFDDKAEIEQYIRGLPIKSMHFGPGTLRAMGRVITNILNPETRIPLIDITDTGKWVGAMLADEEKYEGKFFAAAQGMYSMQEIVDTVSRVSGKTVKHQKLPDEVMKGYFPEAFREQLFEMFLLVRDYGYFGEGMDEQVEWAKKQVSGDLTSFEEYLKKNPIQFD